MKKIKNIYKRAIFAVALAGGMLLTSCSDYLTIIPPSTVTHENFWKTEAEVKGMAANAYLKLSGSDAISKNIFWGELRAETMIFNKNSNDDNIKNISRALLYDDNSYAKWSVYYEAINYCNLVLEYGPLVLQEDPSFSEGEMQVLEGQMKALRAYAHFMLLRAFCNIPMATTVVMSDSDIPEYPQEHPMVVLDQIYADLSDASTLVLKSDGATSTRENLGYITTNAVHAIMADVNMWQAAFAKYYEGTETDYQFTRSAYDYFASAVEHCDYVLGEMTRIYEEKNKGKEEKRYRYDLIQNTNVLEPVERNLGYYGNSSAYNSIFGAQNSSESIFEFQLDENTQNGDGIKGFYGTTDEGTAALVVSRTFLGKFDDDDLRKYAFTAFQAPKSTKKTTEQISIMKYTAENTATDDKGERTCRDSEDKQAHWIVYRKSDIMLMKAEALLLRSDVPSADDISEAFNLAYAINLRWKIDSTRIENPITSITDKEECLKFVRAEKLRELCFEGKVWFDLVREALMEKELKKRLDIIATSYSNKELGVDNSVMTLRYNDISAMFMPIHKDEITYNKLLIQNKSCTSSDDTLIEGD